MKTVILILFVSINIFASNILDSKIKEHCKAKASTFSSQRVYKHVYDTCYKEYKEKYLTIKQLNKKIEIETVKNKVREEKKTALKQSKLKQEAKKEQNNQIMKLPTGDWEISYFIDRFGDNTNKAYITNKRYIRGVFNNSATTNSKLNVIFIITSPISIAIKLFEYARNNPVRESSYSYNDFNVYAKDKDEKSITYEHYYKDGRKVNIIMRANLKEDRLVFDSKSASALHKAFLRGAKIRFNIEKASNGPLPEYSFIFENTNHYNNAIKKLYIINNRY